MESFRISVKKAVVDISTPPVLIVSTNAVLRGGGDPVVYQNERATIFL